MLLSVHRGHARVIRQTFVCLLTGQRWAAATSLGFGSAPRPGGSEPDERASMKEPTNHAPDGTCGTGNWFGSRQPFAAEVRRGPLLIEDAGCVLRHSGYNDLPAIPSSVQRRTVDGYTREPLSPSIRTSRCWHGPSGDLANGSHQPISS
jgi:hypothetical protein